MSLGPKHDIKLKMNLACCLVLTGWGVFFGLGCAGPTTPLGAPWAIESSQVQNGPLAFLSGIFDRSTARTKSTQILFSPPRQVLHQSTPLQVTIEDTNEIKSNYKFIVRYNALDITQSFLKQAKVTRSKNTLQFTVQNLRLKASQDHLIEFIYSNQAQFGSTYARLEGPQCHATTKDKSQKISIALLANFKNGSENFINLIHTIEKISIDHGFSPAFTAALIAQESSFQRKKVSLAKAIGLTQITPTAAEEITEFYNDWPRFPGINEMHPIWIKTMIDFGKIHERNEWRLNPELSVKGGLSFAQKISNRWSQPENRKKIESLFENPELEKTKLILASYNSGFFRVQTAFERFGKAWLSAPDLKEAKNYVQNILSLCDSFQSQAPSRGLASKEMIKTEDSL